MEEGDIRFYAQVQSLVASMEAAKSQIAGMQAENEYRLQCGHQVAYAEDSYFPITGELHKLSQKLNQM